MSTCSPQNPAWSRAAAARSRPTTRQPLPSSLWAVASPIPLEVPVTTAVLMPMPSSSQLVGCARVGSGRVHVVRLPQFGKGSVLAQRCDVRVDGLDELGIVLIHREIGLAGVLRGRDGVVGLGGDDLVALTVDGAHTESVDDHVDAASLEVAVQVGRVAVELELVAHHLAQVVDPEVAVDGTDGHALVLDLLQVADAGLGD